MYEYEKSKIIEKAAKGILAAAVTGVFYAASKILNSTNNIEFNQKQIRINELESKRWKTKKEKAELAELKK